MNFDFDLTKKIADLSPPHCKLATGDYLEMGWGFVVF